MDKTTANIWILDDQHEMRELITQIAKDRGINVTAFSSLEEGWTALRKAEGQTQKLGTPCPTSIICAHLVANQCTEDWMCHAKRVFPLVRMICIAKKFEYSFVIRLQKLGILSYERPSTLSEVYELCRNGVH